MRLLDEQYTRTPLNGVRRMTVRLQQQGYLVHPNRMAQLMHTMGAGRQFISNSGVNQPHLVYRVYPYLLRGISTLEQCPFPRCRPFLLLPEITRR